MIGRYDEQTVLRRAANSEESEFVAVYGRRRVGKTYLVRETFDGEFAFTHAGVARAGMARQLQAFRSALKEAGHETCPRLTNWLDAFDELKVVVKNRPARRTLRVVVPAQGAVRRHRNCAWASQGGHESG